MIEVGDRVEVPNLFDDHSTMTGTVVRIRPKHWYHKPKRTIVVLLDGGFQAHSRQRAWYMPEEVFVLGRPA